MTSKGSINLVFFSIVAKISSLLLMSGQESLALIKLLIKTKLFEV